jgi:hypothetical protein
MQALAKFVQSDIRYVAIELGIGGWQPHPAPEIFTHRYGDCKDKATLLSSMLHEVGVESFFISINTVRGRARTRPPMIGWFNHEILFSCPKASRTIRWWPWSNTQNLAVFTIFDPTDEYTPFRTVAQRVASKSWKLVTPDGGERETASITGV